jgi:hypothetical protein
MSKTIKIEIEIPDPPEGWVFDGYREVAGGEMALFDDGMWYNYAHSGTVHKYLIAVKATPLWEPSPELVALLQPGWVTRDKGGYCRHHRRKPRGNNGEAWCSDEMHSLMAIQYDLLPPTTIPWDQCCFKIGEPE